MKKRLFSMLLVLCLCAWLVPAGAEEGTPGEPEYKHVETPAEVSTYDAMAAALPGGEAVPDADNIVWISHAKLTQSLTLTEGQNIHTLGKLEIPSGVTLTISNGATVEAEVKVESGGKVLVKAGGTLATTMAGEHAIVNDGTITVNRGGVLRSQKGGNVVNNNGATLHVDGVFYCNGNYDATKTTDNDKYTPWFSNSGTVNGSGQVVVMKPSLDSDASEANNEMVVSIGMTAKVKEALTNADQISVYTQAESIDELTKLNNSNVDGIFLSKDMTEEQAQGGERNRFDVISDLTIGKNLWLDQKTDLYIGSGKTLTVDKDKVLCSGRGNISVAKDGGTLKLGDVTLFGGSGTEAAFIPTSRYIFLSAKSPDAAGPDYYPAPPEWIYLLGDATSKADTDIKNLGLHLIIDSSLTLGGNLTAGSVEMRNTLNLRGNTLTASFLSLGFDPGNESPSCTINGTGTINVTDGATVETCTAYIPADVTLNLQTFYPTYPTNDKRGVLFSDRGRIAVKAGGGTVKANDVTLLSGSGTDAVLVPTGTGEYDCGFLTSAAYRSDTAWPADWLYLIGNGISKGGDISSFKYTYNNTTNNTTDDLTLIVEEGSTLTVEEGKNLTVSSLEWRGTVRGGVNAQNIYYYNDSGDPTNNVKLAENGKAVYECQFNINGEEYNHPSATDGQICLESYFGEEGLSYPPSRSGYSFSGWAVSSGWSKVTPEQLASYSVTTGENGQHYIEEPAAFPIIVTAQWTRNSSGGGGGGSSKPATPATETVTPTDQEAAQGGVTLEAAVKDSTAAVTVPAAEIDRVAGGEEETALVLDVSGLSKPVSAVTLETAALEKIADAAAAEDSGLDGLTVKLTDCAVTLDAEALEAVADQAGGKTVTLAVDVNAENLTDFQKNVVAELDNAVVLDVYLVSDGKRISDFHDGKATLEIPYQWDGEGVLRAVFVRDDGSLEVVPVSWSDGVATVTVGHFSHYAIFTEEALPFMDVTDPLSYYYDAVKWALEQQITAGTTDTTFSPDVACTRAQMVTFLWRAAGTPEPVGTSNPFADVSPDAYYRKAVLWAAENGITAGTSEAAFSPDMTCTRAQMAAFLHRFAGTPASEGTMPFADVSPDAYYHDAVLWAANCGVTTGTSATTFSPNDPCSRGQIVTFLYRSA